MKQAQEGLDAHVSRRWRWSFLIAIAVLLSFGGLAVSQYTRFADALAKVERAYDVLAAIDHVVARLLDAETSYRGYLLTGKRAFLEPYEGVGPQTQVLLSRLGELVADNPSRQASAERLASLAASQVEEMDRTVALHNAGNEEAARARVGEGVGLRTMDAVRAVAAEMRASEMSLLQEREQQATLARRAAISFGVASVLVAIVLGFVAITVERHFERRRVAHVREVSARLAAQREAVDAEAGLRESESFNRSVLDNSGDCIQVVEPDGRLVQINRPGIALMELDDSATRAGQPWAPLWDPEAAAATEALHDAIAKGEGRFRASRIGRQGTSTWWDVIVTPVRDDAGAILRLVAVARDITDQRRAEEERAQLLTSERAARSVAERAARMKDEFVSTLSHELRTPLNAILGWVGVLKQDRSPETLTKALDVLERNSRRQSQMIDDLLDVSRIISGKLRLDVQRLDLAPVIEEAVASAQPAADAKGVRLVQVLGSAAMVQGDPGRLQQVVWNLVSNAIKFTPRGGLVHVTVRKLEGHVQIHVRDTGQGVRADVLPYIFERFRQGDTSPTRQAGGLGLGLAIVKSLVEIHGGSVEATSEGQGLGSVFTVNLPLAFAAPLDDTSAATLESGPGPMPVLLNGIEVLVLDDEPDARDLVQRLLEDAGAHVTAAASAHEALVKIEQGFVPNIIVSDIGMPEQDGYQFMLRVRGMQGPIASVPAAALSALARVDDRKRALLAGYQTHLAKPVDPAELVAMVASLTGRTGGRMG